MHAGGPWRHRTDEHAGVCLRPPRRRPAQREAVGRQWHGGCVPAAPELAPVGRRMRRTHQPGLCSQMGNAMRAERSPTFMRAGEWSDSSAHNRIPALCAQRAISRSINRGTAQSWFVQRPRTAACSSCFRVNPPPPLSPPVCSWRGEYMCSMYGVPSPRTSSSIKFPNDEHALRGPRHREVHFSQTRFIFSKRDRGSSATLKGGLGR